jgi:hypothetical protein
MHGYYKLKRILWKLWKPNNAHREVRRLQARIVKATQAGRWGKVKALQRLLTRSHSAKVLAVKRVTENDGKKTAGVDGEVWDTPQKKWQGVQNLKQRGYRPHPLRRTYIPKSSNPKEKRPLSIPTMKDRAMQALYLLALEPVAETMADPHSYGFRKERACRDAIEQCFRVLSTRRTEFINSTSKQLFQKVGRVRARIFWDGRWHLLIPTTTHWATRLLDALSPKSVPIQLELPFARLHKTYLANTKTDVVHAGTLNLAVSLSKLAVCAISS